MINLLYDFDNYVRIEIKIFVINYMILLITIIINNMVLCDFHKSIIAFNHVYCRKNGELEEYMNGNVIVGQSGGPTSVINSSLVGV